MDKSELAWVRTRILADAKKSAHLVAQLLNWNVTGVEAALLNYMLTQYGVDEITALIVSGLEESSNGPNSD